MPKVNLSLPGRLFRRVPGELRLCAAASLLIFFMLTSSSAQSPSPDQDRLFSQAPDGSSREEEDYRIGPGDVIEVRVFNRPQLSREGVRVDGRGMIRMPLLDSEIKAACLTESELSRVIAAAYLEYQRNPHVDVFVKEHNSQLVLVTGAVKSPGRFQLQRRLRLSELLTLVGGPTEKAGRIVEIIHDEDQFTCAPSPSRAEGHAGEDNATAILTYDINKVFTGKDASDPFVRPGDIINIPAADQAFVIGNVLRPLAVPLTEQVTLLRALAMAGGTLPDTKGDGVRIIRMVPGSATKAEIKINLDAVRKLRAEDVVLQPGDIVEVPLSSGKSFLRSLTGVIVPTVTQIPMRIIR